LRSIEINQQLQNLLFYEPKLSEKNYLITRVKNHILSICNQ